MKAHQLNGLRLLCLISGLILLIECQVTSSQTFQQLSYANAELGQKLIRPTHTTPSSTIDVHYSAASTQAEAPTTPKSTGFFSGLRNFFTGNSATTTTARPSIPATRSTHTQVTNAPVIPYQQPNVVPASPSLNTRTRSGGAGLPVQTISTTTTARPHHIDEFPALPPRRNENDRTASHGTALTLSSQGWTSRGNFDHGPSQHSTPHNAWTNNRRIGGSLPDLSRTTTHRPSYVLPTAKSMTNIHSGGHSGGHSNQHNNNNNNRKADTPLATDAEIEALTETLFEKSTPNIFPSIHVNLQGRTRSSELTDKAPMPLLQVDDSILDATETLIKMRALFDNYESDAGVNEHVSPMERKEENEFLNAVLATQVMRTAMRFLQEKGVVTADPKTHFDLLKTIWFTPYSRISGKVGSSGFEHVFLHEIKNNTIGGLHNWVYFYQQESKSGAKPAINYHGYMKSHDLGTKGQYIKYRMNFDGIGKPVNAMLVGTLPELDMALYTVCFEVQKSECPISFGGTKLTIRTYPYRYRGKRLIGSAFPE